MVTAIILASPDEQVWRLLRLPLPGEETGAPAPPERRPADSGKLPDFLL
jgi:hypothetical protein